MGAAVSDAHTLQCMEVWGGNRAVDNGVVMMGVDAWVFCRPYGTDEAGGDVHYVSSCASGRIVRLIVADVAGHGADVAELATRLRGLMKSHANYADQREVVGVINREFARLADIGKFATAVAATYWTPTDELVMTNAGHPPPLLRDPQGRLHRLDAHHSPMLGAVPDFGRAAGAHRGGLRARD